MKPKSIDVIARVLALGIITATSLHAQSLRLGVAIESTSQTSGGSAIFTGRNPWQLEDAANHQPCFPAKIMVFSEALPAGVIHVGGEGEIRGGGTTETADDNGRSLGFDAEGASKKGVPGKIEINVKSQFGVSQKGISQALELAKEHLKKTPDQVVEIIIDPGEYDLLETQGGQGIIDISSVCPGEKGRLIIRGAGQDKTTLYFPKGRNWLYGKDVYRTSFIGLHMTTREMTVSQGHVVSAGPNSVTLDIQKGFPTPEAIWDKTFDHGRYLKRFTDSRTDPQMIEADNDQYPWTDAVHISGAIWEMKSNSKIAPPYRKGDFVAIKSKSSGNTYFFSKGSDFAFIDCKWTQISRGVFRHGFGNITVSGCAIERMPSIEGQTPCLSTPDGGPQIGQLKDPPVSGNVVENCRFIATGDDAIAFFNASGVARNNFISDSFASGINRENSFGVFLEKNTVIRCDVTNQIGKRE